MEGLNGCAVEVSNGGFTAGAFFVRPRRRIRGVLQGFPDSFAQLRGCGIGERDRGDLAHVGASGRYKRKDAADETGRLACTGPRLDDHVVIEALDDCLPRGLVDVFGLPRGHWPSSAPPPDAIET